MVTEFGGNHVLSSLGDSCMRRVIKINHGGVSCHAESTISKLFNG